MSRYPRLLAAISVLMTIAACRKTAPEYVTRGQKLFQQEKYTEALLNFRKAIELDHRSGEAYYQLGVTELKLDQRRDAARALIQAVDLSKAKDDLAARAGNIILQMYLQDQARSSLLRTRLTRIADLLETRDGNTREALRVRAYLAQADGKPREAIALLQEAGRIRPLSADLQLALCQAHFDAQQPEEGLRIARELIHQQPAYGPIYDALYVKYLALGQVDAAEELLRQKVRNNAKQIQCRLQLAAHYGSRGQADQQAAILQELLDNPKEFPAARLAVGDYWTRLGSWDEAIRNYDEGARLNDAQRLTYEKRALRVYQLRGDWERAMPLVDAARTRHPDDPELRRFRAIALLECRKPELLAEARRELAAIAGTDARDATVRYHLARASLRMGDSEAARRDWQQAARLDNGYLEPRYALLGLALDNQEFAEALRQAEGLLRDSPGNPKATVLRAAALRGLGRYRDARNELASLAKTHPGDRELAIEQGFLCLAENKLSQAEVAFRAQYRPGSEDLRPLAGLLSALEGRKQYRQARQLIDEEGRVSPGRPEVELLAAENSLSAGNVEQAIRELTGTVARYPNLPMAHFRLGQLQMRQGQLSEAIGSLKKARELAPGGTLVYAVLTDLLQQAGRIDEAKQDYERWLKVEPDSILALNNFAYLIAETDGDLVQAEKLSQAALRLAPREDHVSDTLGLIYLKQKRVNDALQVFRNLVRKNPESAVFQRHLGMALLASGKRESGLEESGRQTGR